MGGITAAQPAATMQGSSYPNKPVRVIVSFAAGTGSDILTRVVTDDLRTVMGVNFVVDNRAGAAGQIATELAARAAPDGYTLLMGSGSVFSVNPFLYRKLGYDPVRDFSPVALLIYFPFFLVVSPGSGIRTVPELIAYVRANPGKTSYAFGNSAGQVASAYFVQAAKLDVLAVPYKSTPAAMIDLIGGQMQFMFVDVAASLSQVKSGRLRAIGVASDRRSTLFPDLPAVGETVPGFDITPWGGFFAPAGTPKAIVNTLSAEIIRSMNKPAVVQRLTELGMEPRPAGPAEFDKFVREQLVNWGRKVRPAGIQPE